MATQRLATWASTLSYRELPDSVVKAAVRSFQNSLGCIIGGSSHATVQRVVQISRGTQSKSCTCLGQSNHSSRQNGNEDLRQEGVLLTGLDEAVLINGIASHVDDYDDTHLHTVIHPAGAIVVSLLAYAEYLKNTVQRPVSGEEFITALVVGVETSLRLGNSISPNHYSAGWHITGTVSPLGVAAAISNLLRLNIDTTIAALGIASTQPVGLRVHFGTDTKAFHAGRAAQVGVQAVRLAQAGMTAATDSLEGKRGWVEILGHGANSLDEQIAELLAMTDDAKNGTKRVDGGGLWEIEKNTFKPFPCGIVIHPVIDGCISLREQYGFAESGKVEAVQSVKLRVNPLVLDLTGKKTPKDGLEAKFSVYHGAAIGLLLGSATPAEYDDKVATDPRVIQIRDKVTAEADKNIRSDEAFIQITMDGGDNISRHIEHAVGSLQRPMADSELREKFLGQVEPVLGRDRAVNVDKMAWDVVSLADVTGITQAAA